MSPKVSIIIATHSRPNLLPRAIESAFNAGKSVEVIVVDDASSDETAAVCRSIDNIRYVRVDRNQRTAGARNIGIVHSTAPYLGFLDDDDWRLPGSLEKQVEILDKHPNVGLVYGQYLLADQAGQILNEPPQPEVCEEGDLFWKLLVSNRFGCLTAVFRKECILRVGLLDTNFPGSDDWDLWVRIAELYPIAALKEPVAVWRKAQWGTGQGSSDESFIYSQVAALYEKKLFTLPRVVDEYGDRLQVRKREFVRLASERVIHDMAYGTPRGLARISKLWTAVKISPGILFEARFYKSVASTLFRRAKL